MQMVILLIEAIYMRDTQLLTGGESAILASSSVDYRKILDIYLTTI